MRLRKPKRPKELRKLRKASKIIFGILISLIICLSLISAIPPLPTELYGRAFTSNLNVSIGTTIEVLDSSNNICGTFTVQTVGTYGLMSCIGDDTETGTDEGAVSGESLSFQISGQSAIAWSNVTYTPGEFINVNISIPIPTCGDNLCDFHFEDSSSCPADCDFSNATGGNATTNETTTSTPSGAGSSSTGAGGGGGGGGGSSSFSTPLDISKCEENWECSPWGECNISSLQSRECTDQNNCGSEDEKPLVEQSCTYIPTCYDGEMNGFETDVDCGGQCPSCAMGKSCKIHNDCRSDYCINGICRAMSCEDPEIYCFDGLKNCGEDAVDCGGPCDKECPTQEKPGVLADLFVCEKESNPLDNKAIFFFLIVFASICYRAYYTRLDIKKVMDKFSDEKIKEITALKRKFAAKRKFYLFTAILLALTLVLYLYYYFFFLCETEMKYIWWLVGFILALPFMIHFGMKIYEYNEDEKIKKMQRLNDRHYQQVMKLISLENTQIKEMEDQVINILQKIEADTEFRKYIDEFPEFKRIHEDIKRLYEEYGKNTHPYEIEKDLCQQIYDLETDPHFQELAKEYEYVKRAYNLLRILYEQYEQKQELYDQLDKIESGWEVDEEEYKRKSAEMAAASAEDEDDGDGGKKQKKKEEKK